MDVKVMCVYHYNKPYINKTCHLTLPSVLSRQQDRRRPASSPG